MYPGAAPRGYGLDSRTHPRLRQAATTIGPQFGIKNIGGYRPEGSVAGSYHPRGLALDWMINNIPNGTTTGSRLEAYLFGKRGSYGINELIWNRMIRTSGRGWSKRSYYGPSAHTDHVHSSHGSLGTATSTVAAPTTRLSSRAMIAKGGVLSGPSVIGVGERGPERVLSAPQTRAFENLVRVMDRGGGKVHVEYHLHAPNYVGSRDELRQTLVDMARRGQLQVIQR